MKKGKNLNVRLSISMFLLLMVSTARARKIYVDDDGAGANNGSSWTDAYNYLQDALADAHRGDEIRVAQGTYRPDRGVGIKPGDRTATFQLLNRVTMKGGYAGFGGPDPNERNINKYETVLSGDLAGNDLKVKSIRELWNEPTRAENSYHVVSAFIADPSTILDGFIITAGNANVYDPLYYGWRHGGGMYNWDNPTIMNCQFKYNSALFSGGGMYNILSEPILINCTFDRNSSISGGGIRNQQDNSVTLINCRFSGNWARDKGGGICDISDGITTLINCTFSGNIAQRYYGGGIYGFDLVINSCTFTGNSVDPDGSHGGSGGGLYGSNTIINCIFWGNFCSSYRYPQLNNSRSAIPTHSCIEDWSGWGQGNIDANPCFVQPGYWADENDPNILVEPNHPSAVWFDGDYHLKSQGWRWDSGRERWDYDEVTSRCIDAGNPGSHLREELHSIPDDPNNTWGTNLRINMGAYGGTAEASMAPYGWNVLADLTNDGIADFVDLAQLLDNWLNSGSEWPGDLDRNAVIDMVDFALLSQCWLKGATFRVTEPPVVSIIYPEDGAMFASGTPIEIEADASDSDGSVVKVEFFGDRIKAGEDNNGSDGWKINLGGGQTQDTYLNAWVKNSEVQSTGQIIEVILTVRATDDRGAKTVSPPVRIYIASGGPPPPPS